MKHFPITFRISDQPGDSKYGVRGKDKTFDSLNDMLQYYETNPIDPGLMKIGRQVTKNEWDRAVKCIIL